MRKAQRTRAVVRESSGVDWSSGGGERSEAGGSGAGQEWWNRREPRLSRGAGTDGELSYHMHVVHM